MPYQKHAFTAAIYPALSRAGLYILALLLWCAVPSPSSALAAGANASSTAFDQRQSLLPAAIQGHSLRVRSTRLQPADAHDRGPGEAFLPAMALVDIVRPGNDALVFSNTPWVAPSPGHLPPSRAPPVT